MSIFTALDMDTVLTTSPVSISISYKFGLPPLSLWVIILPSKLINPDVSFTLDDKFVTFSIVKFLVGLSISISVLSD